ncbi:hypothetical protein [Paenibacillus sp. HB172176]|uniref:hypothetical protein n=1 Tax=Paenibacillus sp. HB172176 TaxID=2493690 RepID=UPI001439A358|nr:hypothetical protein [Paenibacillus sp. HB172176]
MQSYCDFTMKEIDQASLSRAKKHILERYPEHIEFLAQLPLYHEDRQHIYVHAGLNPAYTEWREQPEGDFMYIKNDFICWPTKAQKTVIFGHTQAKDIHGSSDVWFGEDKIGIDGGCAFGNQLNALIYENKRYTTCEVKWDEA